MFELSYNPGVRDFLLKLGAEAEVIDFIDGLEDSKIQGKLANEVRKKPDISIDEIREIYEELPGKRSYEFDPAEWSVLASVGLPNARTLATEVTRVESALQGFTRWLAVEFAKNRIVGEGAAYGLRVGDEIYGTRRLLLALAEMLDWFHATHPRIASYSFEQAVRESGDWHAAMEEVGEGLEYDGTEEIVHSFPGGWTIRRITSDNDLAAEGNKMGHCVASYCEKVHLGTSLIFSLRDDRNRPHATIEMLEGGKIRQIQGKGNKLPIEKYRKLVGRWLNEVGAYIEKQIHPALVVGDISFKFFPKRIREMYAAIKDDIDPDYGVKRAALIHEHPRDPKGLENALYHHIVLHLQNWIDRTGEGARAITDYPDRAHAMLELIDLLAPKVDRKLIGEDYIARIPDREHYEDFAGTGKSWTMHEDEGKLLDKYRKLGFDIFGRPVGSEFRSLLKMESLPSWLFKWGMAEAVGLPVHRPFRSWLKRKAAEWE